MAESEEDITTTEEWITDEEETQGDVFLDSEEEEFDANGLAFDHDPSDEEHEEWLDDEAYFGPAANVVQMQPEGQPDTEGWYGGWGWDAEHQQVVNWNTEHQLAAGPPPGSP